LDTHRPRPLERFSMTGALGHASIPGAYAWAVTVAPLAWGRGSGSDLARIAGGAAFLCLGLGAVLEPRFGQRARYASLWGFFIACGGVWASVPALLSPSHLDAPRQVAGTLGWGLFAFASAAPPLPRAASSAVATVDPTLHAHRLSPRGEWLYAAAGTIIALSMQLVGLQVVSPERALLVRFVTLAAGLATIGASTELAFSRRAPRGRRSPRARLRSVFAPMVLLVILLLAGVLVADQG
jgi:hypothetical protein